MQNIKNIRKKKFLYVFLSFLGFALASLAILYIGSAPSISEIKEGDISLKTIYAPYDFTYPTSVDEEETKKLQKEFEAKAPAVYDINASIQDRAFLKLDNFFDRVNEASRMVGDDNKEKIEFLREGAAAYGLADKDLQRLLELKETDKIRKVAKDALESVFLIGIAAKDEKEALLGKKEEKISVRNPRFRIERETAVIDLVDEKEAAKVVRDTLERIAPKDKQLKAVLYDLIDEEITPNTMLNEEETKARKLKAKDEAPPMYKRFTVRKNELIVERGKKITKDDIAKIAQITQIHFIVNRASYVSGLFIILVGLILAALGYLNFFEKNTLRTPKHALLISINAFLTVFVSVIIIHSQISAYIIPLAGIGMILALLLNIHTAFISAFTLSVYIGFLAGNKLDLAFMLFIGSVAGIYAMRGARKRSQIFFAGFAVSAANFFSIVGIGLLDNMALELILTRGIYGLLNGVISSFVVIGLLPIFEYAFGLITNITLLELSDLSNPLLKELTIKAPGTYHHSILVGNLAEEACDGIGANSLLARVGSYYHDIGKIEKSMYFVENESGTVSKHDKLTPSMSALIITNHTKDGVELAKKYKLNDAIVDFINQHHGTSLIYYFYQRALEKIKSEEELKEEEFRYPGPKPQTKETAIVLLADSVEASSRMLSDPTPARIRGLVEKIINNKFIDGQLDECDLTLRDLHKISESFVRILMGVFHTRLEYPEAKTVKKEKKNVYKNKHK